ncbi:MAG: Spy/CpxP family protein refolding chaperone [Betaproteobacteria bacterium]
MKLPITFFRAAQVALAVFVLSSTLAAAQFPGSGTGGGGRQRGGDKGGMPRTAPDKAASHGAIAIDPLAAIYRELPSLKVDMKITPEQMTAWNAFADGVREANNAAINRARRAAMTRPRDDAGDAPSALQMFSTLAEEDAQRAETMLGVKVKITALVASLTTDQRRMFDRRIALAQQEPLNNF